MYTSLSDLDPEEVPSRTMVKGMAEAENRRNLAILQGEKDAAAAVAQKAHRAQKKKEREAGGASRDGMRKSSTMSLLEGV